MANDKISNMTAAAVAALTGTGAAVEVSTGIGGVPATKQGLLRDLRTAMFAGGTGYTASDPLVCGNFNASGAATLNFSNGTFKTADGGSSYAQLTGTAGVNDTGTLVFASGTQSASNRWLRLGWDGTNARFVFNDYESGSDRGRISNAGSFDWLGAMTVGSTLSVTGTSTLTGNVGIGGAGNVYTALDISSSSLTSNAQRGIVMGATFSTGATTQAIGILISPKTAAGSYTIGDFFGININNPSKGASSAITTNYGIYIDNQTAGTTNYAIYSAGGQVNLGLPTSSAGLASGSLWSNSGVVTVA